MTLLNGLERQIAAQAKNKEIAVFLDYDGTLSPIVDDPDRAIMSDAMRAAVKDVAKYFPTAKAFPCIVIAEEREWRDCVQNSAVVVNLAGLPISTRWSPELLASHICRLYRFLCNPAFFVEDDEIVYKDK